MHARVRLVKYPCVYIGFGFFQFTVGKDAPPALKKSLMYKLSYHRFGQATKGFDFARKVQIGTSNIELKYFEEVYTTENWVVRIYKVR